MLPDPYAPDTGYREVDDAVYGMDPDRAAVLVNDGSHEPGAVVQVDLLEPVVMVTNRVLCRESRSGPFYFHGRRARLDRRRNFRAPGSLVNLYFHVPRCRVRAGYRSGLHCHRRYPRKNLGLEERDGEPEFFKQELDAEDRQQQSAVAAFLPEYLPEAGLSPFQYIPLLVRRQGAGERVFFQHAAELFSHGAHSSSAMSLIPLCSR